MPQPQLSKAYRLYCEEASEPEVQWGSLRPGEASSQNVDSLHGFERQIEENISRTFREGEQERREGPRPFFELRIWRNMDGEPAPHQESTIIFKDEFLLDGD